jgi:hypothetical protein
MLSLSRKQMTILLLVLVSFLVAMAISMTVIHAVNPGLWHQLLDSGPDVPSHY